MEKELTKFYTALALAATFARRGIVNPAVTRKALAVEERLIKLAATSGKSAKPRRARPLRKTAA